MLIFDQISCFFGHILSFSACGEELRKEKGNIESPNYPSTYPANAACVWIITVPIGYQVNFKIQNIQVSLMNLEILVKN